METIFMALQGVWFLLIGAALLLAAMMVYWFLSDFMVALKRKHEAEHALEQLMEDDK